MKRFFSSQKFEKILSVDRSGLINKSYSEKQPLTKERETEVGKILKSKIQTIGPLSVSSFMNECLVNPKYGYYYKKDNTIFGKSGDFITNPEISGIYGQLLCVWIYKEWENLGKPSKFNIIELGPGNGTLMKDILNTSKNFKDFKNCLNNIHLIDISPNLISKQIKTILNQDIEIDLKNQEKIIHSSNNIFWNSSLEDIPNDVPFILIAHEFFDALPAFQFYYTEKGWKEVLIDVDDSNDNEFHFKYVLAPGDTFASKGLSHLIDSPLKVGNKCELSPISLGIVENIYNKMKKSNGGSVLIIDYGNEEFNKFTLQGIQNHKFVNELSLPGEVDLSIHVNFGHIKKLLSPFKDVKVFGTSLQSDFLYEMGIDAKMSLLLQNSKDEDVENIIWGYNKLVNELGLRFKFLNFSTHFKEPIGFQNTAK